MQNLTNTANEGIQCKVTKLWSIWIDFNPLISGGNKRSYMLLKQTWNFKYYDFLLPPGFKVNRAPQMSIICCIYLHRLSIAEAYECVQTLCF